MGKFLTYLSIWFCSRNFLFLKGIILQYFNQHLQTCNLLHCNMLFLCVNFQCTWLKIAVCTHCTNWVCVYGRDRAHVVLWHSKIICYLHVLFLLYSYLCISSSLTVFLAKKVCRQFLQCRSCRTYILHLDHWLKFIWQIWAHLFIFCWSSKKTTTVLIFSVEFRSFHRIRKKTFKLYSWCQIQS